MTATPSISVVVAPTTAAALELPLAGVGEVIVVGDGDVCLPATECASVRRVRSKAPAGQRANIGISLASGDWIAVLTGTERLSADWISALTATVSNGEVCAHRLCAQNGGLPLTVVWRPAFSYGALDGRIENAAQALEHWLTDIFPRHRHRVLPREGVAQHEAAWLRAGAEAGEIRPDGARPNAGDLGNGYDPQRFWEAGGSGWVKWEAFQPDEAEIRAIVEEVRPRRVLEIGCGGGRNARYFAGAERYAGIDISMPLLARARDRQDANGIGLVCGDASRLPFADCSFDLVFAVSTIQHVVPERITSCIADIARVARRQICLIEFTEELPGAGGWFDQPHMFRHDYAALLAPHAELRLRRPTALQIQPAVKELFLFDKRH